MKRITIEVIPHSEQRLPDQPGDWFFDNEGNLVVRVSDLGDWRFNFLLGRHEMDEAMGCKHAHIPVEEVDAHDARPGSENDDPDSLYGYPGARYQKQHNDALAAEWVMARNLDVDWDAYGQAFERYWHHQSRRRASL